MTYDRVNRTLLAICATILIFGALYLARSILAPVAFAVFIIAILWPLQMRLQTAIPKLLALSVTFVIVLVTVTVLGYLMIWGFSHIARWLIGNAPRFQVLYAHANSLLEGYGFSVVQQMTGDLSVSWLIGM